MKEIKCLKCNTWNKGESEKCSSCSSVLLQDDIDERNSRDINSGTIPIIKIKEDDSLPIKGVKHIARVGQLIFLTIISFIAAMASSTVH